MPTTLDHRLADWRDAALALEGEVTEIMVGLDEEIRLLLIAVFARGHVLLEGDVGVGKTTLLRALSRGLGGGYERIDGNVDLLPSDLVYYTYLDEQGRPRVDAGPLLGSGVELAVLFFNEINRARPQVHSQLLRVMEERSVLAFNEEHPLPHLQVFADRNRIEKEETFELPSAARDRFFMEVPITAPTDWDRRRALMFETRYHRVDDLIEGVTPAQVPFAELGGIAETIQDTVTTSPALEDYGLRLWQATRDPAGAGVALEGVEMDRLIQAGASPRAASQLGRAARVAAWLEDRDHVLPEDLQAVFPALVGHRVFFTPGYERRRETLAPALTEAILQQVGAP